MERGASIEEVVGAFWPHVGAYYCHSDGRQTSEVPHFKMALRPLRHLYGGTPAREFGPLRLKAARKTIRGRKGTAPIKTVRRWASAHTVCRPARPDGPVLVLPSVRINGQLFTIPEWDLAFEVARQKLGQRRPPQRCEYRTPRQRKRAHERAKRRLDERDVS